MKQLIFFCVFIFSGIILNGQSIKELRNKKERTLEQIKYTSQLLNEARKNEKLTLNKLKLINEQIEFRGELLGAYNKEINLFDGMIDENTQLISSLENDLSQLKNEYAGMIRFAQKNRNSYDKILFLLSSKDFNQAYKRLMYLKQYAQYRQKQANLIVGIRDLLDKKVESLEKRKLQKQSLLENKQQEVMQLEQEKNKQEEYINQLQKRQKDLQKELRLQQKIQEELERVIKKLIEEEAHKARERGTSGFVLTPEQKLIMGKLEQNQGRLPWPVERGIITERFGIHAHPVLKTVKVKNNGVDISTSSGTKARAVFDGEVSRVFGISGGNMAVILRHGNYLTVYSNLKEVIVKAGDKVKTKQDLGTVFTDENDGGKTILKFQIWKESQKLNPELWLSK